MKMVIQRVLNASVTINQETVSSIEKGFLVFLGIGREDTREDADKLLKKMIGLRIFPDDSGKTNLALKDVSGELLIVSQFTLYADCRKGYRPSFIDAAPPQDAETLYEYVLAKAREEVPYVASGVFGGDMKITLTNDGPFTILLES